jgi:peptide subunit release factor RF-3
VLRWISSDDGGLPDDSVLPTGARLANDVAGKPVILFENEWSCNYFAERNPKLRLTALPPEPNAELEPVASSGS